jgi:hypothetical protein
LVTCLSLLTSLLVTAAPAGAYVNANMEVHWAVQNAYTCGIVDRHGSFRGGAGGGSCYLQGTYEFGWDGAIDAGGQNLMVELFDNGNLVGQIHFAAYGEELLIGDLRDDGDTFYVTIGGLVRCACGAQSGDDWSIYNLDLVDDTSYSIKVTDTSDPSTDIFAASGGSSSMTGGHIFPYLHP